MAQVAEFSIVDRKVKVHRITCAVGCGQVIHPATALVAPAIANAIFAATGQRLRSQPFSRHRLA